MAAHIGHTDKPRLRFDECGLVGDGDGNLFCFRVLLVIEPHYRVPVAHRQRRIHDTVDEGLRIAGLFQNPGPTTAIDPVPIERRILEQRHHRIQ